MFILNKSIRISGLLYRLFFTGHGVFLGIGACLSLNLYLRFPFPKGIRIYSNF